MGKFLLRFLSFILVSVVFVLVYVSYFGVLTDKFDVLIKSKANEVNQNVQLDFNKTIINEIIDFVEKQYLGMNRISFIRRTSLAIFCFSA